MQTVTGQQAFELALQRHQAGRLAEAEAIYRQILAVEPQHADALHLLGVIAHQGGRNEVAVDLIRQSIALAPRVVDYHSNLGEAYRALGRLDAAIAAQRAALEIDPHFAPAQNNLGLALAAKGCAEDATAAYRRAVALDPDYAAAHYNLGNALKDAGQFDAAVAAYQRALQLQPKLPGVQNNLAVVWKEQGRLPAAIGALRAAIRLAPADAEAASNLLLTLHYLPEVEARALGEEHRRWNQLHAQPLAPFIAPHRNAPAPERRLRLGYVSPDFREHVAGRYLLPLIEGHDRDRVEVICYSGAPRPDRMTERFRARADRWRDVAGVNDESLARLIRDDEVDILVDSSQHMAGNRLPVFARQPAPVQVSFLGYPAGTGLAAIGGRISDRHLESGAAAEAYGSGERVFLIDSFWCFDPLGVEVKVNALPAFASRVVTFGCLGNFCKVNPPVLALWARVLGQVKGSRLVILSPAGSHREGALAVLGRAGVAAERVEFVESRPRREYLDWYHRLDLVLDTFPYNGHTTSLDALWMGVPVVSLAGALPVSRAGLSQSSNLGLPELVAHSEDQYVKIASELAGDRPRLARLRATLRARMEASALMDAPRFSRQIEQAYREMWRAWCARAGAIAGR